MEPVRVQQCMTSDGVRIAYSTTGQGRPLIFLVGPGAGSDVEAASLPENDKMRAQKEGLARGRMLVNVDFRGQGQSEHRITDYSLDAHLRDIDAVAGRLGHGRFDLFALHTAAPIAITYCARNPERVAHLILWNALAKGADSPMAKFPPWLTQLLDSDWPTFTEVFARLARGWADDNASRNYAATLKKLTQESFKAQMEAISSFDSSDDLSNVTCPTLVLHRRGLPGRRRASSVAASIEGAQMISLEGSSGATFDGNLQELLSAVDDFLTDDPAGDAAETSWALPSGTAIILFADIVDSTVLTERLGDAAFREKARDLDGALRTIIRDNSGTPIEGKLLGDGVLATFSSASQAIAAALACGRAGEDGGLPLHLGLHAGDVIREDNNVFGGAVNMASRISGLSAPGEVLVSRTIADLARTSADVSFEDRGEHTLKGIAQPQRVFAVRKDASSGSGQSIGSQMA